MERVLKIKIDHLEYPELQKSIKPYYESKGVRLDVYLKDSDQVFDIEVQASEPVDPAKRTRYYQSMVDIDCLTKGSLYEELPTNYIIFFCTKDWLKSGLPVAIFENTCRQKSKFLLQDGCIKIFLNAELWEKETDIETKNFLNYLYTCKATDDLTSEIENKVIKTKINEIFRNDYLSMNLHDHDLIYKAKNDGIAKGRQQGLAEGIQENKIANAKALIRLGKNTLEDISKCCELPLETVNKLAEEIKSEK